MLCCAPRQVNKGELPVVVSFGFAWVWCCTHPANDIHRIREGSELLAIKVEWVKQKEGCSRPFSEDQIRSHLEHYADLFMAIMIFLMKEGRAARVKPGWWSIDE
jgi:hypothetical protein